MYSAIAGFAGTQPFNDWFVPDTVQRHVLGTPVLAVDPFWGHGKFIYTKSTDAVLKGSVVMWDELFALTLLPSTGALRWAVVATLTAIA